MTESHQRELSRQDTIPTTLWAVGATWLGLVTWFFGSALASGGAVHVASTLNACLILLAVRNALSARRWARLSMIGIAAAHLSAITLGFASVLFAGPEPGARSAGDLTRLIAEPLGSNTLFVIVTTIAMAWSIPVLMSGTVRTWFESGKKPSLSRHQTWIAAAITFAVVVSLLMAGPTPRNLNRAADLSRLSNAHSR